MRHLVLACVLLLTAGLFLHSKPAPPTPVPPTDSERATWHDGQQKHWKYTLLRKD